MDVALRQSQAKFVASIEFRYFYVGTTNLVRCVSVATSNAKQAVLLSKAFGLSTREAQRKGTRVEHFDNVNVRDKTL